MFVHLYGKKIEDHTTVSVDHVVQDARQGALQLYQDHCSASNPLWRAMRVYEVCIFDSDVLLTQETVDTPTKAAAYVQLYQNQGLVAFYREVRAKAA